MENSTQIIAGVLIAIGVACMGFYFGYNMGWNTGYQGGLDYVPVQEQVNNIVKEVSLNATIQRQDIRRE